MKNSLMAIPTAALFLAAGSGSASAQQMNASRFVDTIRVAAMGPGLLDIVTNNSQQQIEVVIGPEPGDVRVSGVSGISSNFVYMGITSISVTTGRAQDFVEFRILSGTIPDIAINTGAGNSDVKFTYEIPASAGLVTTNATVVGGTGNDKVAFNVEGRSTGLIANWSVNHGNGANETTAFINSPELSDQLAVSLNSLAGTGSDKLDLGIVSAAADLDIALTGSLGTNTDAASVQVLSLVPTTGDALLNLDMGTGNDSVSAEIIAQDSTFNIGGQFTGGDGLDALVFKMESDGSTSLQMDSGSGNDVADMFYKGFVTGNPRLLGGLGNDELKIVVDGPLLADPFIDGGPGYDKAIGFGTIVNVEEIN